MKKMKKVFSAILAATMVMSMSLTALADMNVTNKEGQKVTVSDASSVTITKNYNATNEGTTSPAETFTFTIKADSVTDAASGITKDNMPTPADSDITAAVYNAGDAGKEGAYSKDITVTLPEYSSVGVYTYIINEKASNTAGVTYYTDDIKLVVTVLQDESGKLRVAAVHTEDSAKGEKKSDEFANVYSAGSLVVKKVVAGNLGDQSKAFSAKVVFTAPANKTVKESISYYNGTEMTTIDPDDWTTENGVTTATADIIVKHGDNNDVTFSNIPYDVTYVVSETDYTSDGYETDISYDDNNKTIDTASESVTITNTKGVTVDTGISLDNMPYIMVLALVALGLVGFVSKKRSMEF